MAAEQVTVQSTNNQHLVHFDYTIDLRNKPKAGEKANGTCKKEKKTLIISYI